MDNRQRSLFPAANSPQRSAQESSSSRNKVALRPGRSLMDWVRLGQTSRDLSGAGGNVREVTPQELARHNSKQDCWIALSGRVYNITPYMEYHPGGEDELMRAAGRDGTRLFNEVHKWVNFESMLQKCLVGRLVASTSGQTAPTYGNSLTASRAVPVSGSEQRTSPDSVKPRFDFYETDSCIKLSIYTRSANTAVHDILVGPSNETMGALKVLLRLPKPRRTYQLHFVPHRSLGGSVEVMHAKSIGKFDVSLTKQDAGIQWKTLGQPLSQHDSLIDEHAELTWKCRLVSIEDATHDTKLFTIQLPPTTHLIVPTGCHMHFNVSVGGMELSRSYTPVCRLSSGYPGSWLSLQLLFLIKCYEHGSVTPKLWCVQPGDELSVSGYSGNFCETIGDGLQPCSSALLLAAGTGITPMIKLVLAMLSLSKYVHLIFFNKTERDIIWHEDLERLSASSDKRFKVDHVLSQPSDQWKGSTGRITDELLATALQSHQVENVFVGVCGPSGFSDSAKRIVTKMNIPMSHCHVFEG